MSTSNELNELVLSENVHIYGSNNQVEAKLFRDRLDVRDLKASRRSFLILMSDMSGSSLGKRSFQDKSAFLTVYVYNKANPKAKRTRKTTIFEFKKLPTYDENLKAAFKWHTQLVRLLPGLHEPKPFLIFVNPKSGAGKAVNIYHERILSVLSEANMPHKLVLTEYANYAREYVKTLNLADYRGIVAVSGDGLVYEIINGLMERADWEAAIKTPITQIPGGSANALACNLAYMSEETFRTLKLEEFSTLMTFSLLKASPVPLDLISIELANGTVLQSFLTVEWAIIADVDLESEKYRFLGDLRFTIGGLKRILKLRTYKGRVSFLPSDDMKDYKPKDSSIKITQNSNQESEVLSKGFKYLTPIDKPVPGDWLTIEEEFVLFLIMNMPVLTTDFTAIPSATLNDGYMHLLYIKKGISKLELLKLFSDTESGNHVSSPFVEHVKIKAFRLEPLSVDSYANEPGHFMIDGELIPSGVIQGEIRPSMANVLAVPK